MIRLGRRQDVPLRAGSPRPGTKIETGELGAKSSYAPVRGGGPVHFVRQSRTASVDRRKLFPVEGASGGVGEMGFCKRFGIFGEVSQNVRHTGQFGGRFGLRF